MLALLKGDYYGSSAWWSRAIGWARTAGLSQRDLGQLNMKAGTALVSDFSQSPLFGNDETTIISRDSNASTPDSVYRSRMAEPFFAAALKQFNRSGGVPANCQLFSAYSYVEKQLGNDEKYGDILKRRIADFEHGIGLNPDGAGDYAELASYYRDHLQVKEAEHFFARAAMARELKRDTWSTADDLTTLVDYALGFHHYQVAADACKERLDTVSRMDIDHSGNWYLADAETNYARVLSAMGEEKKSNAMMASAWARNHGMQYGTQNSGVIKPPGRWGSYVGPAEPSTEDAFSACAKGSNE
jgi:hypothetical protein